jgi:hypothetical protein
VIHLVVTSRCMVCDWTDTSEKADLNARKHVDKTQHAVITESNPREGAKDAPRKGT